MGRRIGHGYGIEIRMAGGEELMTCLVYLRIMTTNIFIYGSYWRFI